MAGATGGGPSSPRAGVSVVPVPDCGHTLMLDNPEAFASATASALAAHGEP